MVGELSALHMYVREEVPPQPAATLVGRLGARLRRDPLQGGDVIDGFYLSDEDYPRLYSFPSFNISIFVKWVFVRQSPLVQCGCVRPGDVITAVDGVSVLTGNHFLVAFPFLIKS